jgi:hypothetical protein
MFVARAVIIYLNELGVPSGVVEMGGCVMSQYFGSMLPVACLGRTCNFLLVVGICYS